MLKQRILTVLVLLSLLLPALWMRSPVWLTILMVPLLMAATWEWSRLNLLKAPTQWVAPLFFNVLLFLTAFSLDESHFVADWLMGASGAVAAIWVLGIPWMLSRGMSQWLAVPQSFRLVLGWLLISACAVALVAAHQVGLNFLLSVLCLVWGADIFAYFGGRLWGRSKLAPSISPGKTWAGVLTAVVGVLCLAALWVAFDTHRQISVSSIFTLMWQFSPLVWVLGTLSLVALSVSGDLVESLVKRVGGFKDSSQLLPGHGGVLDRIDALLPVLPVSMFIHLLLTS